MALLTRILSVHHIGPSRPAAKPSTHASRHHLEPNPFEQSFSSKPSNGRSASPEGARQGNEWGAKKLGHKSTKSDSGLDDGGDDRGDDSSGKKVGGPSTPGQSVTSKRILPPLSSIASPAGQESGMHYPWAPSLTGSLRAGPLSPAMLAGPQNFDPSTFRTGLTPDLSSFKTGLTPLGSAGASFPPPSPNTAAFLAMVTNSGTSGLSAAAITPNTLSALSGNPMDAHTSNGSILAPQPAPAADQKQQQGLNPMRPGQERGQRSSPKPKNMGQEGANGQGNHTDQAASGLFLLSQAHQELSKREGNASQRGAFSSTPDGKSLYSNAPVNGSDKPGKGANKQSLYQQPQQQQPKNGKRKSSTDGGKGAGKKSKASKVDHHSPSGESDELFDDYSRPDKPGSSNGGGSIAGDGDDDEKRRNFLERNRQAALKCRQRKKAWLASLQAKVEYLQSDNENLQGTVGALRNEVMFLKSQLMQAQRQLAGSGVAPSGPDVMSRHSVSGPMGMPAGMIPASMQQVPHSNIHAMAAAAAAAATNGNNMMGTGQYQAHPVPRPTHMPANNGSQFGGQNGKAPRQNSVQAV